MVGERDTALLAIALTIHSSGRTYRAPLNSGVRCPKMASIEFEVAGITGIGLRQQIGGLLPRNKTINV
jgi:hypothetical protein